MRSGLGISVPDRNAEVRAEPDQETGELSWVERKGIRRVCEPAALETGYALARDAAGQICVGARHGGFVRVITQLHHPERRWREAVRQVGLCAEREPERRSERRQMIDRQRDRGIQGRLVLGVELAPAHPRDELRAEVRAVLDQRNRQWPELEREIGAAVAIGVEAGVQIERDE